MHLIAFCMNNPVKVAVGVLLVVLFGLISLKFMPVQLTPEVERPEIEIETRWPGASPQEVEREIVQVQEEQLKGVQGILKISSQSYEGVGRIALEFAVGTNMSDTMVRVGNLLQQVKEYPPDADKPVILPSSSSDRPMAWIIMKPQPGRDDIDITEYGKFAEDYVAARIKRVPKVGNAEVSGGREPELQVVVDPQQLAARQLTMGDLRRALVGQNKDTSGGVFREGKRQYTVRTRGQFTAPEQVEGTIVAYRDGGPVYVRDIAAVRLGFKQPTTIVRRGGETAVSIRVTRETGANVLDVLNGVQKAVDELNVGVLKQRGLELYIAYDERGYVYAAIGLVNEALYVGGLVTAVILFLFLRHWRSTAVICLTMPISIIGTFLLVAAFGRTLNVVSLAGLAFAVGMVVDNAVVVLENIHRRCHLGEPVWEASLRGSQEVWGAVLASTLTHLAVFVPVIFIRQEVGQLFKDIAIANSCAVGLSLIVAVFVIPVLTQRFLRHEIMEADDDATLDGSQDHAAAADGNGEGSTGDGNGRHPMHRPDTRTVAHGRLRDLAHGLFGVVYLCRRYVDAVVGLAVRLQRGVVLRVAVVVLFLGGSAFLSWIMAPDVEYLPEGNRNLVLANLLPPPGYNTAELINIGKQIEEVVRPYWEVKPGSPEERALGAPAVSDTFFIGRDRRIMVGVRSADLLRGRELVPLMQRATAQIPGTIASVSQSSLFERGSTGGRTIDVEITGPVLENLVDIGSKIRRRVLEVMPDAQAIPRPSLDLSSPELHVVPRLAQSAELGLSARELGYWVDALTDGAYASDYWSGHDKIDLTIMAGDRFHQRTQDLAQTAIAAPTGQLVPLDSVAEVVMSSGPEQIFHREQKRAITIQVRPDRRTALEAAIRKITDEIITPLQQSGDLGSEIQINLSGTADKLNAAWDAMRWNLMLALLITYLLMAGLFESWTYPAIIMISVPPAAVGGLAGLWLLNRVVLQPLDVITMLGFVTLIGIVVNNAILIVHQALNHMRNEGMPYHAAIIESLRNRMRPVFMTTITTLVGMLPLVVAPGAGSELYRGLGAVVLGGLAISTLFTLILVPVVFTLTLDFQHWLRGGLLTTPPGIRAPADVPVPLSTPAVKVVS